MDTLPDPCGVARLVWCRVSLRVSAEKPRARSYVTGTLLSLRLPHKTWIHVLLFTWLWLYVVAVRSYYDSDYASRYRFYLYFSFVYSRLVTFLKTCFYWESERPSQQSTVCMIKLLKVVISVIYLGFLYP
jgi:hypothetical protein